MSTSELSASDIDLYDFYSCFPIVPKLACDHLGLSITNSSKPLTVLGGLTSFGGAGNNYSMHVCFLLLKHLVPLAFHTYSLPGHHGNDPPTA